MDQKTVSFRSFSFGILVGLLSLCSSLSAEDLLNYKGSTPLLSSITLSSSSSSATPITAELVSELGGIASVFSVDSPARLVIDLPTGSKSARALRKPVRLLSKPHPLLEAVRIAAHDDKVRIVIDLKRDIAPPYSLDSRSKRLVIRIGTSDAAPAIITAPPAASPRASSDPKPPAKPTAVESPTVLPSSPPTPQPTPASVNPTETPAPLAPTEAPTLPAAMAATPVSATRLSELIPSPADEEVVGVEVVEGPSLMGVLFEDPTPGKEPTVRLALNHRPRFRISRRDDQSFRLRIDNCKLGHQRLTLPYFPPQDFVGFTLLQASLVGSGIEVIIGADRGTRISATPSDTDILLRAVK